jgi:hypothetical protein
LISCRISINDSYESTESRLMSKLKYLEKILK